MARNTASHPCTSSSSSSSQPAPPYASSLTFCSSPMYGTFHLHRLWQWVEYHRLTHGIDLFHLYDAGGVDEALMATLDPHVRSGLMTVTDISGVNRFDTWYAQVR